MSASCRVRKTGQVRVLGLKQRKVGRGQSKAPACVLQLLGSVQEKGEFCLG